MNVDHNDLTMYINELTEHKKTFNKLKFLTLSQKILNNIDLREVDNMDDVENTSTYPVIEFNDFLKRFINKSFGIDNIDIDKAINNYRFRIEDISAIINFTLACIKIWLCTGRPFKYKKSLHIKLNMDITNKNNRNKSD